MNSALARHADYRRERLASLRTGVTIGSPEEFMLAVDVLGATELCNIYGATETCGNCAVTWHHWPLARRANGQGPPLPGQELRFVDEVTGALLPPGTPGLTEVRGDTALGYRGVSADQNIRAFTADGFYRTGDMGMLNAEGDFVFVGRVSDMIKRAGIDVSPAEVEAVLLRHPSVREAAVVGVPDALRGERIFAVVVTQEGRAFDADALMRHCSTEASKYKLPDHIETFTIVCEPFQGLPDPPYAFGYVMLDGADTAIGGSFKGLDPSDPAKAAEVLKVGTRVKTVFAEKRIGDVLDVWFEPEPG